MNCRDAESLIFAARDGALDESQRAGLAEHLGQCSSCSSIQADLAAASSAWRSADATVRTPAIEVEWHAIRRRIRGEQPDAAGRSSGWLRPLVWGLGTLATAAAIAFAVFLGPRADETGPALASRDDAYVSYVVVHNTSDSTMVYEDAESGWLVVWLTNEPGSSGT